MTGNVIGLDLSLRSTGVSNGHEHRVVQPPAGMRAEERLIHIRKELFHSGFNTSLYAAEMVVVEGPAYGKGAQSGHDELAGLRWIVRASLHVLKVPFAVVPPTVLKRYVTGTGNAPKGDMVAALDERFGTELASVKVSHGRSDMADAFGLASMGYDFLGSPIPGRTEPCRAALSSVVWPDLLSV